MKHPRVTMESVYHQIYVGVMSIIRGVNVSIHFVMEFLQKKKRYVIMEYVYPQIFVNVILFLFIEGKIIFFLKKR
jgi:hypothetical protein